MNNNSLQGDLEWLRTLIRDMREDGFSDEELAGILGVSMIEVRDLGDRDNGRIQSSHV